MNDHFNVFQTIDPVRPPAPYVGGKRKLAGRICQRIAEMPHTAYSEAFVGMGGVFFRRQARPRAEVINDRNGEVANLFRILQRHYPQFMETLRFQITSRREFERLRACDPRTLTDLERAGRFLYLQRTAFGGKASGQTFGVSRGDPGNFNLTKLAPLLEEIHERLSGVVIECLDWTAFIDRYDMEGMLFYLDPPYFGSEHYYGEGMFGRDQFAAMAERLARIKGRFVLSINDTPEIRETFAAFQIEPVDLLYSVASGAPVAARELVITAAE